MTDELIIEAIEDDDLDLQKPVKTSRKTSAVVNKYEYTCLLWCRALQLTYGDPPCVNSENLVSPLEIAMKELHERKIPLFIERELPNGEKEYWNPNKMNLLNH